MSNILLVVIKELRVVTHRVRTHQNTSLEIQLKSRNSPLTFIGKPKLFSSLISMENHAVWRQNLELLPPQPSWKNGQ